MRLELQKGFRMRSEIWRRRLPQWKPGHRRPVKKLGFKSKPPQTQSFRARERLVDSRPRNAQDFPWVKMQSSSLGQVSRSSVSTAPTSPELETQPLRQSRVALGLSRRHISQPLSHTGFGVGVITSEISNGLCPRAMIACDKDFCQFWRGA